MIPTSHADKKRKLLYGARIVFRVVWGGIVVIVIARS